VLCTTEADEGRKGQGGLVRLGETSGRVYAINFHVSHSSIFALHSLSYVQFVLTMHIITPCRVLRDDQLRHESQNCFARRLLVLMSLGSVHRQSYAAECSPSVASISANSLSIANSGLWLCRVIAELIAEFTGIGIQGNSSRY